jgi:hypothetical protein
MSRATGVHFDHSALRLVTLQIEGDRAALCAAVERRLPLPLSPEALRGETSGRALADILGQALSEVGDTGAVQALLPGGWYQMQKVPLEVASAEDRRNQMAWEAAQGVAAPASELEIAYVPARRSAFWLACRRSMLEALEGLFQRAGLSGVQPVPGPVALLDACRLSGRLNPDRSAAVWFDLPWLYVVSVLHGEMHAAESVRTDPEEAPHPVPQPAPVGICPAPRGPADTALEALRRWLAGNLGPDRRRAATGRLLVCGDRCCTDPLLRAGSPEWASAAALLPFASCTIRACPGLPDLDERQPDFAIAAGLAYGGIDKDGTR